MRIFEQSAIYQDLEAQSCNHSKTNASLEPGVKVWPTQGTPAAELSPQTLLAPVTGPMGIWGLQQQVTEGEAGGEMLFFG